MKRTPISGALGFVARVLSTFVASGVLRLTARVEMNLVTGEREVRRVLKEKMAEPCVATAWSIGRPSPAAPKRASARGTD